MPRLPRPYIPLDVRVKVAARQCRAAPTPFPRTRFAVVEGIVELGGTCRQKLDALLRILFDGAACDLDHDPPLGARRKVFKNGVHVDYDPPANDPDHLVYRPAVAHRMKTNVRGEHGQHPDRVLIKKNRRIEKREANLGRSRASKARPKVRPPKRKWPSRPFPKGRKFNTRSKAQRREVSRGAQ